MFAFEFLMRPSSIGAGYAAWSGYRGASAPDKIIVNHRKNGERAEHPLEYRDEATGEIVKTYHRPNRSWPGCRATACRSSAN